jgi:hypothetical protein
MKLYVFTNLYYLIMNLHIMNKSNTRVILIVLDSVGIGKAPDATLLTEEPTRSDIYTNKLAILAYQY